MSIYKGLMGIHNVFVIYLYGLSKVSVFWTYMCLILKFVKS